MSQEKGFTLLEVMAALAIMVIALVPILENQALSTRSVEKAVNTTQASIIAASILAEYSAIEQPKQRKVQGKIDIPGYENYSYDYVQNSTGFPGVNKNTLTVRWSKNKEDKLEINTYAVQKSSK